MQTGRRKTSSEGAPIGDFRKAWRTACRLAGVPERLLYDLRRSGARDLVRAGVSQSVVMSIGGWKTDAMFRRYNITSDTDQRAALTAPEAYSAQQITPAAAPEPGTEPSTEKITVQ